MTNSRSGAERASRLERRGKKPVIGEKIIHQYKDLTNTTKPTPGENHRARAGRADAICIHPNKNLSVNTDELIGHKTPERRVITMDR